VCVCVCVCERERASVTSLLFTLHGCNVNSERMECVSVCVCVCARESESECDFTSVHTAWVLRTTNKTPTQRENKLVCNN